MNPTLSPAPYSNKTPQDVLQKQKDKMLSDELMSKLTFVFKKDDENKMYVEYALRSNPNDVRKEYIENWDYKIRELKDNNFEFL